MLTDEAKKLLIKKGSNTDFGARPLRRAIENFVEDPLSEELLKGEFQGKDTITVDVEGSRPARSSWCSSVRKKIRPPKHPSPPEPNPAALRRKRLRRFASLSASGPPAAGAKLF